MKHLFKIIHLILIACQLSAMDQQLLIDQTDHAKKAVYPSQRTYRQ